MPYFLDVHLLDKVYQPNRERLRTLLLQLDEPTETTTQRGDALEDFTREFLESCKLFDVLEVSRVNIGQIDAACRVKCIPGLVTQDWSSYLPVECKNWKARVGFPEIATLSKKMEDRHSNTGLLVATEGVTGNWKLFEDALGEIRNEFVRGRRILVIVRPDLEGLVEGRNLLHLLQEKLDQLHFQPHKT